MSYVSESQLKKILCDAAKKIRLCVPITVNGIALTKDSTFYDLLIALNGLSGGSGSFTALSQDVVSGANGGATTIQSGVVTNAKLATVPALTFKGNATNGVATPQDLTVSQMQALMGVLNIIPPTSYTDITAQIAVTANSTVTQDTTRKDVVMKDAAGDTIVMLGNSTTSSAPLRVQQNGADIRYFVVSGTPTVSFAKASGVGTVTVTGGEVEIDRVQVDFHTTNDTDATNSFKLVVPTTQGGTMLQYPLAMLLNTQNGAAPATTNHLYKNQGSIPVISVVDGVADSFITIKATGTNAVGSTASLVTNF